MRSSRYFRMKSKWLKVATLSMLINISGLAVWTAGVAIGETEGKAKTPEASPANEKEPKDTFSGNASWYGPQFQGKKTADGEIFDMNKCSAAHRQLHLPTKILVENPQNGKSTIVKVNDRGPYNYHRVLDLSRAAAIKTGVFDRGVAYIQCTVITTK